MSLGRQERLGVIILAAVTLIITACGLLMRYCVPHTKPLPEKTVIYKTETVTDTVYRERKRSGKKEGKADKKTKKSRNNGRKSRKEKNSPAAIPVRDFLKDTIPASR